MRLDYVNTIPREGDTYCFDHVVNKLLGLVDLLLGVGHDETVQVFILIRAVSSITPAPGN